MYSYLKSSIPTVQFPFLHNFYKAYKIFQRKSIFTSSISTKLTEFFYWNSFSVSPFFTKPTTFSLGNLFLQSPLNFPSGVQFHLFWGQQFQCPWESLMFPLLDTRWQRVLRIIMVNRYRLLNNDGPRIHLLLLLKNTNQPFNAFGCFLHSFVRSFDNNLLKVI